MLIELTRVSSECDDEGRSWLMCPGLIVGLSKAWPYDEDYSVDGVPDGKGGLIYPCKYATCIDVIGGGEYYVKESRDEVSEKWEAAISSGLAHPDSLWGRGYPKVMPAKVPDEQRQPQKKT